MKVVACVYEFEGKILLLKRVKDRKFGIVGGKRENIDNDELDAIVRECYEEIGIKTKKENYEKICEWSGNPVFYYKLNNNEASEIKLNKKEHSEYLFIEPNRALKLDLSDGLSQIILSYIEKVKNK